MAGGPILSNNNLIAGDGIDITDKVISATGSGGGEGTEYTAGLGLTLTDTEFNVNVDDSSLEINSNSLQVKNNGILNTKLQNSTMTINGISISLGDTSTITAAGSTLSDTVPVMKGGTGSTNFADKSVVITQDSGTDTLTGLDLSTNGSLVIGGVSGPTSGQLQEGNNITISNTDGGISIASTDTDTNTEYTAGSGLTLTGTEFTLNSPSMIDFDGTDHYLSFFPSNSESTSGTHITHAWGGGALDGYVSLEASDIIIFTTKIPNGWEATDIKVGIFVAGEEEGTFVNYSGEAATSIAKNNRFNASSDISYESNINNNTEVTLSSSIQTSKDDMVVIEIFGIDVAYWTSGGYLKIQKVS
jgi:hypothetical protein